MSISFFLFLFSFSFSFIPKFNLSNSEKQVNKTLNMAAKICRIKYKIHPMGEGASMPGDIVEKLFLSFSHEGSLSKDEIRKIVVGCIQELFNAASSNQELQEHLKEKPFKIENVQINLFVQSNDGSNLYDPNISVGNVRNGIITYLTNDPENEYKYKSEVTETYAEALKLLQQ